MTSRSLWRSCSCLANFEFMLVMLSLISTIHISFKASKRIWSPISIETSISIWGSGKSYFKPSGGVGVLGNSLNSPSGRVWGDTPETERRRDPGVILALEVIIFGVVIGETARFILIPLDLVEFDLVKGLLLFDPVTPPPFPILNFDSNWPPGFLFSGVPTANDNFCISGDNIALSCFNHAVFALFNRVVWIVNACDVYHIGKYTQNNAPYAIT